jgi:4Fe-4S ferredoxin
MFNVERTGSEVRKLKYNDTKCLGCGICTGVCPTASLRLGPTVPIARGLIEMDLLSVNADSCVLCGLCSVACPFDALSLIIDDTSIKEMDNYPSWEVESEVNEDDCLYCGRCTIACPRDAILFERKLPEREELVRGEINIDNEKCIYCGYCADLCPPGAIKINNVPSSSVDFVNNSIEVDASQCVYCGICKRVCPQDAILEICSTCMLQDQIEVPEISGTTIIVEDDCVNCSWCAKICPVDAINIIKPFTGKLELVETEEAICKGDSCHACQDVCPCNAVEIVDGKAQTNLDFCNLCGACISACPQHIRELTRTSMKLTNVNSESWDEYLNKILNE